MESLFGEFNPVPENARTETCRLCANRERWECGNSIIQYCGVLSSNRTFNKKLKIKCKNQACEFYKQKNNKPLNTDKPVN